MHPIWFNGIFNQLSKETGILKIGLYLDELDNYNDFENFYIIFCKHLGMYRVGPKEWTPL